MKQDNKTNGTEALQDEAAVCADMAYALAVAEKILDRYEDAFKELAK